MGSSSSLKDVLMCGVDTRVLVLDGGVSTHLEDMLIRRRRNAGIARNESDDDDDMGGGVFAYRELWSSSLLLSEDGKQLILKGHKDWIDAGVDIISTVTYQCHFESTLWPTKRSPSVASVRGVGVDEADIFPPKTSEVVVTEAIMDEMWKNGIELARKSIEQHRGDDRSINRKPHQAWVVASSGCYGAALANGAEYTGIYSLDEDAVVDLYNFHYQKLKRIVSLKPDGIAFESIPNLEECKEIVKLLNFTSAELKPNDAAIWISLACQNESQLNDGTPIRDVIRILLDSISTDRLHGIGFNCCNCDHVHGLVTILIACLLEKQQRRAIVIYPNSGEDWDATTSTWRVGSGCTTPTDMAQNIINVVTTIENEWRSQQSTASSFIPLPTIIVGGCCRTRPATIAALRGLLDEHLASLNSKNKSVKT